MANKPASGSNTDHYIFFIFIFFIWLWIKYVRVTGNCKSFLKISFRLGKTNQTKLESKKCDALDISQYKKLCGKTTMTKKYVSPFLLFLFVVVHILNLWKSLIFPCGATTVPAIYLSITKLFHGWWKLMLPDIMILLLLLWCCDQSSKAWVWCTDKKWRAPYFIDRSVNCKH